jgi:hypothetical protein
MNDKKARGLFLSVTDECYAQHMSGIRPAFQVADRRRRPDGDGMMSVCALS